MAYSDYWGLDMVTRRLERVDAGTPVLRRSGRYEDGCPAPCVQVENPDVMLELSAGEAARPPAPLEGLDLGGWTCSRLKSLVQKIVRFRPERVGGTLAEVALEHAVRTLVAHPGSFVPDISRFVTGREAAFKRLVVISYEDSDPYCVPGEEHVAHLATALCAQRVPWFTPSATEVDRLVAYALKAFDSPRAVDYSGRAPAPQALEVGGGAWATASALLDTLGRSRGTRSFSGRSPRPRRKERNFPSWRSAGTARRRWP